MTVLFGHGDTLVTAEDNPRLVELSERHNEIIDEFNELNHDITAEEVPSRPGRSEKDRYDKFGERVEELQGRMLEWENEAKDFIMLPEMTLSSSILDPDPDEQRHVQSHVISFVESLRSDIQSNRVLLVNNYNRLTGEAKEARNFWYAIWSFRMAGIGLLLALASLAIPFVSGQDETASDAQVQSEQIDEPAPETSESNSTRVDTSTSPQ